MAMTAVSQTPVAAAPHASVRARFAVGAFWSLVGAVVARGLTLAAFVVAGRLLGTIGFGEVGLVLTGIVLGGVLGAVIGLVLAEGIAAVANQVVLRRLFPPPECRTASGEPVWRELAAVIRFSGLAVLGSLAVMLALWLGNVVM